MQRKPHKPTNPPEAVAADVVQPTDNIMESGHKIRFKLFGIGGAGGNVVNHITAARSNSQLLLTGVDLIAINTDAQALGEIKATERIQIGTAVTRGLSAGGDADLGARAAQGDAERLELAFQNVDIAFLTVGLGGGTGSGAAPVIARLARAQGALVLAFATMPFGFEGERRQQQALVALEQLRAQADAVICIPNDKLSKFVSDHGTVLDAFKQCNEMIATGAQAIWQLLSRKGLINLDFADLRATLGGKNNDGMFSYGVAEGADKARDAVKALMEHPLFDGGESLAKADGVLVSILGGPELTLSDVQRVAQQITAKASRARVTFGAATDENFRGRLAVTVIAASGGQRRTTATIGGRGQTKNLPANGVPRRSVDAAPARPGQIPIMATPVNAGEDPRKQKDPPKAKQETLPLDAVSRGRFDQSERTLYEGEDLDVPTYLRRGVRLELG